MKNEIVLAIIKKLIDEKFNELSTHAGRRGLKGSDGKDFIFSEHEEQIASIIHAYVSTLDLKLKFSDLSEDEKLSLKGQDGIAGRDGKDFSFEEHRAEIEAQVQGFVDSIRDDLKLKFSDLTDDDVALLKGKDGKDFSFEEIKDDVTHILANIIEVTRDDLKLRFEDLTDEEKESLRGDSGLDGRDGRDGRDFIFSEHIGDISLLVNDYVRSIEHSLKLKFSDLTDADKEELRLRFDHLTQDQKDSLKLKFDDLTEEEKLTLKGARGQRGKKGDTGFDGKSAYEIWLSFGNVGSEEEFLASLRVKGDKGDKGDRGFIGPRGLAGKDGKDGEDAPYVTNVEINDDKKEFSLVFYFSDGSVIETNSVKLPEIRTTLIAGGGGASGGGGGGGTGEDGKSAYEIAVENGFVGTETEWLASLVGPQGPQGIQGEQGVQGLPGADGADGADGLSAYQIAVNNGFIGTEAEWLESLKATIEYFDEGVSLGTASEVDFVGSGVTATKVGDRVTVSITSGSGTSGEVLENVACESDVYVGAAVYFDEVISGPTMMSDWPNLTSVISLDANNSTILAKNALANAWETSHVVGIVESKSSATLCNVRIMGKTTDLYLGLDLTKDYYLSHITPGLIVMGENAPKTGVLVRIGRALSQRSLFVSIGERVDRL